MDILSLLFAALALGLVRGSSICVLVCAPGMIPYIVEKRTSIFSGLKYGLVFNIPRIIFLTVLGAIVGYVGFQISQLRGIFSGLGFLGYVLIALLLLFLGFSSLRETFYPKKNRKKRHPLWRWRLKLTRNIGVSSGTLLFFLWGSILSIACLGEIAIFEAAFIGGVAGSLEVSQITAAELGALVMFIFALGAAIPVLTVTTLSGYVSGKVTEEMALKVKIIGAMLMILIAFFIIGSETYLILRR